MIVRAFPVQKFTMIKFPSTILHELTPYRPGSMMMKPRTLYQGQMDKKLRDGLRSYQRKHVLMVTGVWDLATRSYMERYLAESDTPQSPQSE